VHHLLAQTSPWVTLSGINTEWDFVEAPSQLLEEWTWDAAVLQRFARHVETGAPIPAELVAKLRRSSEFGKGMEEMRQVLFAAISYDLHARDPKGLDLDAAVRALNTKYSPYPEVPGTHMHGSFGHLEGYSSMYYTYRWSLVLAKDVFTRFESAGLLDPATARAYRDEVLRPGGRRDARQLVEAFLGRAPSLDAYRRWIERD
jgi:thimet oligopeptidase